MSSKRRHEGYILIDNRNCPVPQEVIISSGLPIELSSGRGLFESATITCSHCHAIVILNPDRSRPRGYCRRCDHYVCDNPGCNAECKPFNEVLAELQTAAIHKGVSHG